MKYLAAIPFVNREELLRIAVNSAGSFKDSLVLIDNSADGSLVADALSWGCEVVRVPGVSPMSFSQTMNFINHLAGERGCGVVIVMHNDAEAGAGVPERLLQIATDLEKSGEKWGAIFTNYDALCAFNRRATTETGRWDVALPQYFADDDYYYRMQLLGYRIHDSKLQVTHHGGSSSTIRSDEKLWLINGITFPLYHRYYVRKWGGAPGRERYEAPFNSALFSERGEPRAPVERSQFYKKN
jgi:hypothetical protein